MFRMFRTILVLCSVLWVAGLAAACVVVQPDPTEDNLYSGVYSTARFIADPEQATEFNKALWEAQLQRERESTAATLAIQAGELAALEARQAQSLAVGDRILIGIGVVFLGVVGFMAARAFYVFGKAAQYRAYLDAQAGPPGYAIVPRHDPRFRGILLAEGGYYSGGTPMMDGQEVTSLSIPFDRRI